LPVYYYYLIHLIQYFIPQRGGGGFRGRQIKVNLYSFTTIVTMIYCKISRYIYTKCRIYRLCIEEEPKCERGGEKKEEEKNANFKTTKIKLLTTMNESRYILEILKFYLFIFNLNEKRE
jgi:ATP/ADP translocase